MKESAKEHLQKLHHSAKDALFGDLTVTLMSNQEALIENFHHIVSYDEESICVTGNHVTLHLDGQRLTIRYYAKDIMKVCGCIHKVWYQR